MSNIETINKIKVSNMQSPRGGIVANQFIIETDQGTYFQSYASIIAFIPKGEGKTLLDKKYYNFSNTTGKYRNIFLGELLPETNKKINSGEYLLTNLN